MELAFYIVLLLLGLAILFFQPVAKRFGTSANWEIAFGALTIIVFAFFVTSTYVMKPFDEEELAKKPCGPASPQGACYNLNLKVCEEAWASSETACKAEMAEIMRERASALIGPAMNRCRAKKMDQVLRFNRINTTNAYCKEYFDFIDTAK